MDKSNTFKWDAGSAIRKGLSNTTVHFAPGGVGVDVKLPETIAKKDDAYRRCSRCHRHWNYHKGGECPK